MDRVLKDLQLKFQILIDEARAAGISTREISRETKIRAQTITDFYYKKHSMQARKIEQIANYVSGQIAIKAVAGNNEAREIIKKSIEQYCDTWKEHEKAKLVIDGYTAQMSLEQMNDWKNFVESL